MRGSRIEEGRMIEKLRMSWRSYREKMRQQQIDHALYKAGGGDRFGDGGGSDGDPLKKGQSPSVGGGGP